MNRRFFGLVVSLTVILVFAPVFVMGRAALASLLELVHFDSYAEYPGLNAGSNDAPRRFPIWGHLGRPEGKGPFPAVLLMHGCGGIRPNHFEWANMLNELGFVTLVVDSFRPRNTLGVCRQFSRVTSPPQRALDAYGGLAFLQSRSDVIADQVGIIGWSHGGISVLHAVNRSGVSRKFSQAFRAAAAFYPWCMTDRSFDIPLLIMIGEEDNWTPASYCKQLLDHNGQINTDHSMGLVVYPQAHHSFDDPEVKTPYVLTDGFGEKRLLKYDFNAHQDAIERLGSFLRKQLR